MSGLATRFAPFGTRSLLTHGIMAVTLSAALAVGILTDSQVGLVSFIALLNFSAGMWVCQSIHSLGHAAREDDYQGIITEIRRYVD